MKYLKYWCILSLFCLTYVALYGCTWNDSDGDEKHMLEKREEDIGVMQLIEYIQSDDRYKNQPLFQSIISVEMNSYSCNETVSDKIYLATITTENLWESGVVLIRTEENQIVGIEMLPFGGNKCLLKYDFVIINQIPYLAVFSATHNGNGDLDFYLLSELGENSVKSFALPSIIDTYREESQALAIEYGFSHEYDNSARGSLIYPQGSLNVEYVDVDADGLTEIVASGLQQLIITNDEGEDFIGKTFYEKRVYRYDNNNYVLDENLSCKKEINIYG